MKTFIEFLLEKYITESKEKPTPEELKRLGLAGGALTRYERGVLRHSQNKTQEKPVIPMPSKKQVLPITEPISSANKTTETERTKKEIELSAYQKERLAKQAARRLAAAELKFSKREINN